MAIASRACMMQGDREEAIAFARKALKLIEDTPGTDALAGELRAILPEDETDPCEGSLKRILIAVLLAAVVYTAFIILSFDNQYR